MIPTEQENIDRIESNTLTRSSNSNDLVWLQNFQQYLQDVQSGEPNASTYSVEESVNGLEWLFNYALGNEVIGISTNGGKTTFDLPANGNMLTLYNQVEAQVYSEIAAKPDLEFSFMSFEILENGNQAELTTNFKYTSPEVIEYFTANENSSFSCENPPFTDQEFYLGFGGENGEEPTFPSGCSFEECAVELPCEQPNYPTALEMVEAFHNASIKSKFICKGENEMISFSNITNVFFGQQELEVLLNECDPSIEDTRFNACDCVNSDALNCLYCITEDFIENHLENINFTLPEGLELIDIDLFVDFIFFTPESTTFYTGILTFAKVDCVPGVIKDDPPISIEIECC